MGILAALLALCPTPPYLLYAQVRHSSIVLPYHYILYILCVTHYPSAGWGQPPTTNPRLSSSPLPSPRPVLAPLHLPGCNTLTNRQHRLYKVVTPYETHNGLPILHTL